MENSCGFPVRRSPANGQPAAITAEVGGFLGVGQKMVVIGLDRLQLKDDELTILRDHPRTTTGGLLHARA